MAAKVFGLAPDQIKPLVPGRGRCIATDRIVVDRRPVGYMLRDEPEDDDDSGWQFFAGDESPEYTDDPANIGVYDVNTVANYDPDIIPLLDARPGTAFVRDSLSGFLQPA